MDKPERETLITYIKREYPAIWAEYNDSKEEKRREWHRNYMRSRYIKVKQTGTTGEVKTQ